MSFGTSGSATSGRSGTARPPHRAHAPGPMPPDPRRSPAPPDGTLGPSDDLGCPRAERGVPCSASGSGARARAPAVNALGQHPVDIGLLHLPSSLSERAVEHAVGALQAISRAYRSGHPVLERRDQAIGFRRLLCLARVRQRGEREGTEGAPKGDRSTSRRTRRLLSRHHNLPVAVRPAALVSAGAVGLPKVSASTRTTYSPGSLKVAVVVALALRIRDRSFGVLKTTGAAGPECLDHVTFMLGTTSRLTGIGSLSCTRVVGEPDRQFEGRANFGLQWRPPGFRWDRGRPAPVGWKRRSGGSTHRHRPTELVRSGLRPPWHGPRLARVAQRPDDIALVRSLGP